MKALLQRVLPNFSSQNTSFGQDRAERYQQRLQRVIDQRRKLIAVESTAPDPSQLHTAAQVKGQQLEGEMTRLQQDLTISETTKTD